jgi:peptidyl-prolyl cis-trans isomerase D
MLEWMRKRFKGTIIWLIIGIITIVFFLGTSDYLLNRNFNPRIIAKVNNQIIDIDTVNTYYKEQIKQHANKKSYSQIDLDPQKIKNKIIVELINQSAILTGLKKSGFIINDEQLVQIVKTFPQFQENDKFSHEKYATFLKQANFTELQYQQLLKEHLLQEQLYSSIFLTSFVPSNEVNNFITQWKQTRDFGFVKIPANKFINKSTATQEFEEQQIKNYYSSNENLFIQPETVSISYLELATNKLKEQIIISKEELFKYYQEHINYYTLPELVNVKHILILESNEAKAKITELLDKLKKQNQKFDQLAKQYSEDSYSKDKGGELGWIGRHETDPNFEKAAFSLKKPGEISDVVHSKFGYHIIQLNSIRPSTISPFEQILPQVTEHYKEEIAQHKLQTIIEEFENGNLENENLENIANKFNLPLQYAGPFDSRGEANGIASYSEVVLAAFDPKHLNKNSKLIKLTNEKLVVLKTIKYIKSNKKTIEEASPEIKKLLQYNQAKEKAKQQGLIIAKELLHSSNHNKTIKSYGLEWTLVNKAARDLVNNNINLEILKTAFTLTNNKKQKTFTDNNGDVIIVQLLNIHNIEDLSTQPINQIHNQLTILYAQIEQKLFEQDLINHANIKIFNQLNKLEGLEYDNTPKS